MKNTIIEIDKEGYYVRDVIVDAKNPSYPEFYTTTRLPTDDHGAQLPFYKPRFNGEEWVEDLSQEEIEKLKNRPKKPSESEVLRDYILNLDYRLIVTESQLRKENS